MAERVEIESPGGGRLTVSRKAYEVVYRPKGYSLVERPSADTADRFFDSLDRFTQEYDEADSEVVEAAASEQASDVPAKPPAKTSKPTTRRSKTK